jgi:hypothetical protein
MADLFNEDFQYFFDSLNKNNVKYILVGGYAVILHGYIRSTAAMDVWIQKSEGNYDLLKKALIDFGVPLIPKEDFLGNKFDVWSFGMEPNRIDLMSEVKGVDFDDSYKSTKTFMQNNVDIRYIHLIHLLKAKEAAGRFKDKSDIEELSRKNPEQDNMS